MNDNALFVLVRGAMVAGLALRGLTGWKIARKNQTQQQGANSTPTVYLFKIGPDRRHGSPQVTEDWDADTLTMNSKRSQQYESTFQASILLDETTDPAALTPSDAANVVADIMQDTDTVQTLQDARVGILRIGQVVNPYNVDDRSQYAASPSFDFVLTYRREWQGTDNSAASVDAFVNRV